MSKISMFQIREAIYKNVCGANDEDFTIIKDMRANPKMEGDSQLRLKLFVGICNQYGYTATDIITVANLQKEEYQYKLRKFIRDSKSNKRFINKIKLINNYLRIHYGAKVI